ncbi:MAG: hypothetical protein HZA46_03585, partial [Planctomycetales bacterium]|nr:hypothetical protein [Planctomycetales bacterium]
RPRRLVWLWVGVGAVAVWFGLPLALQLFMKPGEVVSGTNQQATNHALRVIHRRFLPNKVLALRSAGCDDDLPPSLRPLLFGKVGTGSDATVYVCEHGTCGQPAIGAFALKTALA